MFKNILALAFKELKSLLSDPVLMVLIIYMFSAAIISVAKMEMTEIKNATVGIVDYDHSSLSLRLRDSLLPPQFKEVKEISPKIVDRQMDIGNYTFIIDIPTNYEKDMLQGKNPSLQLLIDATAMTQAGIGASYISQTFTREIRDFLGITSNLPINAEINVLYNPNHSSLWFMGAMGAVGNMNLIILLLVGSAVIRERERGTIEHLLVMPVRSSEIAMAKILANGLVVLVVVICSFYLVVREILAVPIESIAIWRFSLGVAVFLFSSASLGILLAILAPTMPQFGLLCIPTHVIMYLLSGITSPLENMPEISRQISQFFPTTILGSFAQDILFRGATLNMVWDKIFKMFIIGLSFLILALIQFRSMLGKQG